MTECYEMITTKTEAIELQKHFDELLRDSLDYGTEVQISLALTNKIKVNLGGDFICFTRDEYEPCYLNYRGTYSDLSSIVTVIQNILHNNSNSISLLMESYDNISKLVWCDRSHSCLQ